MVGSIKKVGFVMMVVAQVAVSAASSSQGLPNFPTSPTQEVVEELMWGLQHPEDFMELDVMDGVRGNDRLCIGKKNVAIRPKKYVDQVGEQFVGFCCETIQGPKFFDTFCSEQCPCPVNAGITCYRGMDEGKRDGCHGIGRIKGGKNKQIGRVGQCIVKNFLPGYHKDVVVNIDARDFCRTYANQDAFPKIVRKEPNETMVGKFDLIVDPATGESNTGLVMTHAALLPKSYDVVLWTRAQKPDVPYSKNISETVSAVFNTRTGTYKPTALQNQPFCSGLSYLSDGTVVAMGGEATDVDWGHRWAPWTSEGRNKIRYFHAENNTWETLDEELPGYHWYPTQLTLDDDRIINVGGFETMFGPENKMVEIIDGKSKRIARYYNSTHFSRAVGTLNLYPYLSIVPYTDPNSPDDVYALQFICNYGEIVKITKDNQIETVGNLPLLSKTTCSHFSATGSGKLLALREEDGFEPTFVTFGGTNFDPNLVTGCWSDVPGLDTSYRISFDVSGDLSEAEWEVEKMPFPRVGGTAVVLPNGHVVILNGASNGVGNQFQTKPITMAVLYNPYAPVHSRYTTLAASSISRTYHSNALLMPDGSILVGGGDQGVSYSTSAGGPICGSNYDYEFRAESFKPPYFFAQNRAAITGISSETVHFGETVDVSYTSNSTITGASLVYPSAVTHSTDMSGRVVILSASETKPGTVSITLPKASTRATIQGWHMLYLLTDDNQTPSTESVWVKLEH